MRMRFKPFARGELEENPFVFYNPIENKGKWKEIFKNDNPIHLEIGAGFGKFAITISNKNPNINYVAMEMDERVFVYAGREFKRENLSNLFGIRNMAENLANFFEKDEISKIYINFCNPWPKRNQHKRRLTHPRHLEIYKKILKIGGEIEFKTDQEKFFEDSIKYFERNDFEIIEKIYDLGIDEKKDNIVTEYEQKWREKGDKIYYLKARLMDVNKGD